MQSESQNRSRKQIFKNKGTDQEEMRRRRAKVTVQLRKRKREEIVEKRRYVSSPNTSDEDEYYRPTTTMTLRKLVAEAQSSDPNAQLCAVQAVRKLLSAHRNPAIDPIIDSGMLPILVHCLESAENPDLQFEAAVVLTNIAGGTSSQAQAVVTAGAVPLLLKLLRSNHEKVCDLAAWALGNIIGDGPQLRDFVISLGVVQPLLQLIKPDTSIKVLSTITWVMLNICRDKNPPISVQTVQELLPALNALIQKPVVDILDDTLWTLVRLIEGGRNRAEMVINSGVLPRVISLLSHFDENVQYASLRAVGNIVTATDEQTQTLLNCGVLSHFPALLTHQNEQICEEAMWILSNITAGNQQQIQAVINTGLLPLIVRNLSKGGSKTQIDAAWSVRNITFSGSVEQVSRLVLVGVVPPFCKLLSYKEPEVLGMVLEGIDNMLKFSGDQVETLVEMIEEAGGLDQIEGLQNHENEKIYEMANQIIQRYFV